MQQRIRPRESRNITRHRTDNDSTGSANKRWATFPLLSCSSLSRSVFLCLTPPTLRVSSGTNEPYATQLRSRFHENSYANRPSIFLFLGRFLPWRSRARKYDRIAVNRLTDVVIDIVLSSYLNTSPYQPANPLSPSAAGFERKYKNWILWRELCPHPSPVNKA